MPSKPNTQKRTKVKDLPRKEKKLGTNELKKLKGGTFNTGRTAKVNVSSELLICAHGCPACPHPSVGPS
jgi:hypothetical protein